MLAVVVWVLLVQDRRSGAAGASATSRCSTNQLTARLGPGGVALGSAGMSVYLTNVSKSRCALRGYPDLQMLTSSGRAIPTVTHDGPAMTVPAVKPRVVSLRPGGSATFFAGYADGTGFGTDHCPASTRVAITLPANTKPIIVVWRLAPYGGSVQHVRCGSISVSPVIPGIHRRP